MIASLNIKLTQSAMIALASLTLNLVAVPAESAVPSAPSASAPTKRVVVWEGEQASVGAGWVNPTTSSIKPQTVEAHSGNTALEFKFRGTNQWMGMGWNWFKFKTGTNVGTDASGMKNLSFWIKTKGKVGGILRVNLLCNGDVLDTPEEHTVKVDVLKYCPQWFDGGWHEVVIPLADLDQIKGFDRSIISEIHLGLTAEHDVDGSIFVDDIGFDDRVGDGQSSTASHSNPDEIAGVRPPPEMLVNGNFADGTNNWVVVAETGATGRAEVVAEGPDAKAALRLQVLTVGDHPWRFQFYQTGMRVEKGKKYVLTYWAKSDRTGTITANCMQNHAPWEHHTQLKTLVTTSWQSMRFAFVAPWDDGNIRISFTDLGTVAGQVYWFANCSLVRGSESKATATVTPATQGTATAPSSPFVWKGDCSSETAFVNSDHATIPGHYEYLPNPKEPGRGLVFAGHLTPEFTTTDPEKFHLHPEIYFDRFLPGNIDASFDVLVDDLEPSELGPYANNPWLNVVTLFDETTFAGGRSFHPSVMVNLVGTPGHYRLQAYSIDPAGAGTFYEKIAGGPLFPTGKWFKVRVEVDVTNRQVRVYQDEALASSGP